VGEVKPYRDGLINNKESKERTQMKTKQNKKRYSMSKIVRIEVWRGIAEVMSKPKGISVFIVDRDAQQSPAETTYYDNLTVIRNGVMVK
jgi:hypothetical protein